MHFKQQFNRQLYGGLQHGKHGGAGMGGRSSSSHGMSHGSTRGGGGNFGSSHSRSSSAGHHESAKASERASSVGSSRNTSGGLGLGGGTFHGGLGGKASYGGGQTAHESFSKAVGSSFSSNRHDSNQQHHQQQVAAAITSHTFSQVAKHEDYGLTHTAVGQLTGKGTFSDVLHGFTSMFNDYSTPGGFGEYGYQRADYTDTPFSKRSYSEQWQEDKLGTIANIAKNPMVSAGMFAMGLGAIPTAISVADTATKMAEGDIDMTKGLGSLVSTAITSTTLGEPLGKFRGLVGGIMGDFSHMGETIAGVAGSTLGSRLGMSIGDLTGNPYVSAVATPLMAIGAGQLAASAVREAKAAPSTNAMQAAQQSQRFSARAGGDHSDRRPILPKAPQAISGGQDVVSSGQQAVQEAQQLQSLDPNVLKYIPENSYNPYIGSGPYLPTDDNQLYNPYK